MLTWGGTSNLEGHQQRQALAYYEMLLQNSDLTQLGVQEKPTKIFIYSYNKNNTIFTIWTMKMTTDLEHDGHDQWPWFSLFTQATCT